MSVKQQLRWWEEERKGQESERESAARAIERLTASLEPEHVPVSTVSTPLRDIGEELEEEARVRAAEAKRYESECVAIHYDPLTSARILKRFQRIAWGSGLVVAALVGTVMAISTISLIAHAHGHHISVSGAYGGFCGGLWGNISTPIIQYVMAKRRLKDSEEPALLLSPEGLRIHTIALNRPLIPWNEIENIETKRFWGSKRLAVLLTLKRPPKKPGGKPRVERIYLAGETLPRSAEALVARIATYESVRAGA